MGAVEGVVGLYVLVATLVVAVGAGVVLKRRDGRLRPPPAAAVAAEPAGLGAELAELGATAGDRATLLQFSSAFCAPCRTARVLLADVAATVPGVAHVEVDAESHLELVRRLGVRRTPTVFVLDGAGRVLSRASGAPPSRAAVLAAVAEAVPDR